MTKASATPDPTTAGPKAPAPVFVHAAGGIGAGAMPLGSLQDLLQRPRQRDAEPADLRALAQSLGLQLPRLASRFAQLAVVGSRLALRPRSAPLPADTPLYLGSGLGDIARTDALYYEVMPPSGQPASPAQFATSGNTMPAFFVAQQAGLASANFTVSLDALSLEAALDLACDEIGAGAPRALVGTVDETTLPRAYFVRRFPAASAQCIGEGSGWLLLDRAREGAIGALHGVRLQSPAPPAATAWAHAVASHARQLGLPADGAMLMFGTGVDTEMRRAVQAALPGCDAIDYLPATGWFPTAASLAICAAFADRDAARAPRTWLHVNRDAAGRSGLICFTVF